MSNDVVRHHQISKAYQRALRALKERHRAEFDEIYAAERNRVGIPVATKDPK